MGCSGSFSLAPKVSLVLNSSRTQECIIVNCGEECWSKIWGETEVDKLSGDKDQKIDVFDCHLKKRWSPDGAHTYCNCSSPQSTEERQKGNRLQCNNIENRGYNTIVFWGNNGTVTRIELYYNVFDCLIILLFLFLFFCLFILVFLSRHHSDWSNVWRISSPNNFQNGTESISHWRQP